MMLPFRFYAITDRNSSKYLTDSIFPNLVDAGLRALLVREPNLPAHVLYAHCQLLQRSIGVATTTPFGHDDSPSTQKNGAAPTHLAEKKPPFHFFLTDRADLALSLKPNWTGLHLRGNSMPIQYLHPDIRKQLLVGASVHNASQAVNAEQNGADFVMLSPIFTPLSKGPAEKSTPQGLSLIEHIRSLINLPIIALGGITPNRVKDCLAAGAYGVGSIGALWQSENPVQTLKDFKEALGGEL